MKEIRSVYHETVVHWHNWCVVPMETNLEHRMSALAMRGWTMPGTVLWCHAPKHTLWSNEWSYTFKQHHWNHGGRRDKDSDGGENTCCLLCLLCFNLLALCCMGWWMFAGYWLLGSKQHTITLWVCGLEISLCIFPYSHTKCYTLTVIPSY